MLKLDDRTYLHEAGGILPHRSRLGGRSAVSPGPLTPSRLADLGGTHTLHYNSWWYCSFSTHAVRTVGMPLRIFIHGDDLEYGLRLRHHGFPTTCPGGLSIWHASFDGKHRTWIHYFNFRNHIIRLLTQQGDMANSPQVALTHLRRIVTAHLMRNHYGAAALTLRAYTDLLADPTAYQHITDYPAFIHDLNTTYQSAHTDLTPSQHSITCLLYTSPSPRDA